jgi:hypothetical protein
VYEIEMKKILVGIILILSTTGLCSSANASQSSAFKAGVSWVQKGFPGADIKIPITHCADSIWVSASAKTCSGLTLKSIYNQVNWCASQAALSASSSYNLQQWVAGCISVPYKKTPLLVLYENLQLKDIIDGLYPSTHWVPLTTAFLNKTRWCESIGRNKNCTLGLPTISPTTPALGQI